MQEYDLIVIGAGPAGLTSALYGARANKKVVVLDAVFGGGEAGKIARIDNYPGLENTDGLSLLFTMRAQAEKAGAKIIAQVVKQVDVISKTVTTSKEQYKADAIILATGCKARKLGLENEKELIGYGISYCAVCDGALFKGREVALVGYGKKAQDEVKYLENLASKIYYISSDSYVSDKVEVIDDEVVSLEGKPLKNITLKSGKCLYVPVLFVNIGYLPESELVIGQVLTDDKGYVKTDENMQVFALDGRLLDGIYAVGDVREKKLRQIVTACADGAIAGSVAVKRR